MQDSFYLFKRMILKKNLALWISLLFTFACSKEKNGELSVNYTLGENGRISISADANGAVSYRFSFESNAVFNQQSGEIEYQYPNRGAFTIGVWAFFDNESQDYTYTTIDVEITNASGSSSGINAIDESETVTVHEGFSLVWNDEFNYDGAPSDEKWHLQYIPIFNGGWANNEEQHYTTRRDNSFVSNGTLKIVAKRENYTYSNSQKNYTSARLNSKFDMQYGRIDVRAKLPASDGTWPAIWTLGSNINERGNFHGNTNGSVGWPACGEIDIMEQNGWDKTKVLGHFHWADTASGEYHNYGQSKTIDQLDVSSLTDYFHVYSLVWDRNSMKIYLDDALLVSMSNNGNNPYDNPHYLILNIAMGGVLGGNIPGSFSQDQMEIDYVRFYQ